MVPNMKKYIGRSYEELNCLDLVKEIYKDFFNLEVKNYYEGEIPKREEVQSLIITNRGDFVKIDGPTKFGDLVVIRLYGIECHLGVVLSGTMFIHSARRIGCNMDRLERYSRQISGIYRHREVA